VERAVEQFDDDAFADRFGDVGVDATGFAHVVDQELKKGFDAMIFDDEAGVDGATPCFEVIIVVVSSSSQGVTSRCALARQ
jgi:hypothetical protein